MAEVAAEIRVNAEQLKQADATVRSEPFPFLVAHNLVSEDQKQELVRDFPTMKGAGYLPYEETLCGPSINSVIEELVAPEFADQLGNVLGIERLSQFPTYVSISKTLNKRHGRIHTDGKSKVATMLLYLNDEWPDRASGCLRFLNQLDDINDTVVPEIVPDYGTLVAFKRAENSFHGHLPFEGERRAIQIAWLVSAEDKLRKSRRGKLSHKLKALLGKLDSKWRRRAEEK